MINQHAPASLTLPLPRQPGRGLFGPAVGTMLVLGAFALAPDRLARGPLVALTASLCIMTLAPRLGRIPSHVWGPVLGVLALVLGPRLLEDSFPKLGMQAVGAELLGNLGIVVLILSLAYLAISLDDSGFFRWCALRITRAAAGDGRRLLLLTFLGVSLLTFFTSNDIVILAVTPILLHMGTTAKIRNLTPLLIAQFFGANTASMGLYIGNPTNIIIGGAAGLEFQQYAQRMLLPTLVATAATLGVLWILFVRISTGNRMPRRYEVPVAAHGTTWTRHMTVKVALFGACLASLAVLGGSRADGSHAGSAGTSIIYTCIGFSVLAAIHDLLRDRATPGAGTRMRGRIGRLPFEIIPFFMAFCLLLRGLSEVGLIAHVTDRIVAAFAYGPVVGSLATGFYGVLATNVLNNLPASILVSKAWTGGSAAAGTSGGLSEQLTALDPAYADAFMQASIFATNVGANLTFMGALAGVMWFRILQRGDAATAHGPRIPTAREFLGYGAIVVPTVTILTCGAIGLCCGGLDSN